MLDGEAPYRALFESIEEGACLFEQLPPRQDGRHDYRYLAMNPAMQALFGVPDLSGRTLRDSFPDETEAWYDDYDRVLATGQSIRFERESQPQGLVLETFVSRLEDGSGRRLLAVMKDVTRRRRAEAERDRLMAREQDARREAERAMVLRDEFLAVISHELRTPLSSILLWSKMLREGAVPPAQQPMAIAAIERGASAQCQLIETLLDISSLLSGGVALSLHETALGPLIEATVAAVQPLADTKGVRLVVELGPCEANVDSVRLQQVVWNLVSNAVKFTPAGGTVSVRLTSPADLARLTVTDTGQGITAAFLPHVFERFRQQDASLAREHGGLGLGLSIARQLVEMHGGSIAAASDGQGAGATFTVELPRPPARRVAPVLADE